MTGKQQKTTRQSRRIRHIDDSGMQTLVDESVHNIESQIVHDANPVCPSVGIESPADAHPAPGSESQGPAHIASSTRSVRRGRGKNKNKKFNAMVDKYGPALIQIQDGARLPVGENAISWPRKISEVLNHHCDLHHENWTSVPAGMKQMLENHIKSSFVLTPEKEKDLQYTMGKCYSRVRSNIAKKDYKPYFKGINKKDEVAVANAIAQAKANHPKDIAPEKWPAICDSFANTKWKNRSETNAINRSKMKTNHTAGSVSFINTNDKKTKLTGVKPAPIEFFKDTHMRKNGSFVTTEDERRYHVMEARLNSEDMDCTEEEIVLQALGGPRSGHVRGMGCGVIPPRTRSSFASQSNNHDKCTQETEKKINEVIVKMTAEREASDEKIRAEMVAERQASEVRLREEMREEMQAMLRQYGGHGGSSHGSQSSMGKI